jgi:hypothetical protein
MKVEQILGIIAAILVVVVIIGCIVKFAGRRRRRPPGGGGGGGTGWWQWCKDTWVRIFPRPVVPAPAPVPKAWWERPLFVFYVILTIVCIIAAITSVKEIPEGAYRIWGWSLANIALVLGVILELVSRAWFRIDTNTWEAKKVWGWMSAIPARILLSIGLWKTVLVPVWHKILVVPKTGPIPTQAALLQFLENNWIFLAIALILISIVLCFFQATRKWGANMMTIVIIAAIAAGIIFASQAYEVGKPSEVPKGVVEDRAFQTKEISNTDVAEFPWVEGFDTRDFDPSQRRPAAVTVWVQNRKPQVGDRYYRFGPGETLKVPGSKSSIWIAVDENLTMSWDQTIIYYNRANPPRLAEH